MRLTVVTAVRNVVSAGREGALRRCIESVHAQTCRADIEHLVVDGASTDGTLRLLEGYAARGWLRVVSKEDRGVYEAMNNGLREAKGTYVLFLNSDDRFHSPRAMETALRTMERGGADYGFGDAVVLTEDGRFDSYWVGSLNGLPFALNYCHQAMLVRTQVLKAYGGFDLSYPVSADSHLMLKLWRDHARCAHVAALLVDYQLGGLSTFRGEQAHDDHARACFEIFGERCGLTHDECGAFWHYDGLDRLPPETCAVLGAKLPERRWCEVWTSQLKQRGGRRVSKVYSRWLMSGWRGCLFAVCTKIRHVLRRR